MLFLFNFLLVFNAGRIARRRIRFKRVRGSLCDAVGVFTLVLFNSLI